jgi:hypothetical protein
VRREPPGHTVDEARPSSHAVMRGFTSFRGYSS